MTHTPPEIWKDINHPRTVKFDVYSFGVFLWELITEEKPFKHGRMQYIVSSSTLNMITIVTCLNCSLSVNLSVVLKIAFSALTLSVGRQEVQWACIKVLYVADGDLTRARCNSFTVS